MRSSTLSFFYQEGRHATAAILTADNQIVELRRQYRLTVKALGRNQSLGTYREFCRGYQDAALQSRPGEQGSRGKE